VPITGKIHRCLKTLLAIPFSRERENKPAFEKYMRKKESF